MFEKATRMKLRFDYKGLCSVEDLWDLSLKDLDNIYKKLNKQSKEQEEASLLNEPTKENAVLSLKMSIVKHIVELKLAEKQRREEASERAAKKQKILDIMAEKQDEQLKSMSLDDLNKLVNEL